MGGCKAPLGQDSSQLLDIVKVDCVITCIYGHLLYCTDYPAFIYSIGLNSRSFLQSHDFFGFMGMKARLAERMVPNNRLVLFSKTIGGEP